MREIPVYSKFIFKDETFKYEKIMKRIQQIESAIMEKKEQEYLVAIALERSPDVIFTMLAMLRLGIAFLPLDLKHPKERIQYIMGDSGVKTVITLSKHKDMFPNVNIIALDECNSCQSASKPKRLENELAYVLYTSGTTGNPKGVMVRREGLHYFIDGMAKCIDFERNKRMLCLTTFGFNIFFLESIVSIYLGLTVILASEEEKNNQVKVAELIKTHEVSMLQMTPSAMQMLLNNEAGKNSMQKVTDILIGGEKFPQNLLTELKRVTNARIYNMYGPTETTIWSSVSELTEKDSIDIGKAIDGTEIYILDENMCPVPEGETGEIYISGKGLAKGYLNREELTNEKFIELKNGLNVRAFRTGDLGRFLQDNIIQYAGRMDNQVKMYGYRIELEEIESVINQIPGIEKSLVIIKTKNELHKMLAAYYIGTKKEDRAIEEYLSKKLPKYMIPSEFNRRDTFEYNTNGKLDKEKTLAAIEKEAGAGHTEKKEGTEWTRETILEKTLDIMNTFIGQNNEYKVSQDLKLSDFDIDSIIFIQIIVELEKVFQIITKLLIKLRHF